MFTLHAVLRPKRPVGKTLSPAVTVVTMCRERGACVSLFRIYKTSLVMCCVTRWQKPTGLAAVWTLLRRFLALSICVWRGDRDNKCQHLYDLRAGDKNSLEIVDQIRVIIPIQLWIQDQTFKLHGGLLIRAWPPNIADGHCTFGWANPVRRLIFDQRSLTNCSKRQNTVNAQIMYEVSIRLNYWMYCIF